MFCHIITAALLFVFVSTASAVDFAHDVLPILRNRCAKCHTDGTYKGGLSMDTREGLMDADVLSPGNVDESELIARITSDDPEVRMPLNATPLTAAEIESLRKWIEQQAPWQEGFSFANQHKVAPLPPRQVELPTPSDARTHPVDRLIDTYMIEYEIPRPESISDAQFARRAFLDIVGLLPTSDELDLFLEDNEPNKRGRLVNELLGRDRRYAEHWISFWNDLLRNDYAGTGYIDGGRKQISTWLYTSLLENKPYDQFVRELISPAAESEGFIRGIKWRGRVNASQVQELQFARTTMQVFMGINLKCASCHDSFIDSWKLHDAYGMAAIISDEPLEIYRCDKPTGELATPKFLFHQLGTVDADAPRDQRLEQVAALLTSAENGRLARTIVNRLWQRLMGRGIVEPVDMLDNPPFSQDLLDWLAWDLAAHDYDLKRTIELICTSDIYQSQCVGPPQEQGDSIPGGFPFRGPIAKPMSSEQFVDAVWRITDTAPEKAAVEFDDRGDEPVRASLTRADLLQRSLGRPNRDQVVTTRPGELTMLVALDLTNGAEFASLLSRGAENVLVRHHDKSAEELVDWLWTSALCRTALPQEKPVATDLLGDDISQQGVTDLLWMVFMLPEFQLVQ